MAEKVEIQIVVDKQTGAISVAGEELNKFGAQAEDASKKTEQATSAMGGLTEALGGLVAAGSVISFFKSAVESQIQAEDATNRLSNALKLQGITNQAVTQDLVAFATQLQATTRFGDEAIIGAQTLLTSFGLTGEQLKTTTKAALDLSSALGVDLNSAAQLLGKAAVGETGSLSKYGIIIDENVPKAEKFGAALDQINKRFGGTAQNDINTFGGALAQTANIFDDVKEKIGSGLQPAIVAVNKAFLEALPFIQNVGLAIAGVVGTAVIGIKQVIDLLTQSVNIAVSIVTAAAQSGTQVITSLGDAVMAIMRGRFDEAKQIGADLITSMSQNIETAKTEISVAGEKIVSDATKNQETMKGVAQATFGEIAGLNQQQAAQAIELDNQVHENKKVKAEEHLAEKRRLAEEFTALEQGEFEAKRLRLENEIADLEAKGVREFEIKNNGVTQTVSLEEFKQARLDEIKKAETKSIEAENKKQADAQKKLDDDKKKMETQRIADFKSTLGTISSLTQSNNETLKGIGKSAAITQAIMDTYAGANKALGSAPPPFNFALAAAVVAAGIANVQKIASAQQGGTFGSGDEVLVGERGPELIKFGGAARVEANRDLRTRLGDIASGEGGAPSGGVVVQFTGGITINVQSVDLNDPVAIRQIASGLASEIQKETEEAITFSRRSSDLNSKHSERAV